MKEKEKERERKRMRVVRVREWVVVGIIGFGFWDWDWDWEAYKTNPKYQTEWGKTIFFRFHIILCFAFVLAVFSFLSFLRFFFFFGLFLLLLLLFFANALCLFRTFQHFKLSLSLSLTVCFVCVCCIISLNRMCVSLVKECSKCDPENSDYNSQRVHYVIWPCWTAMPFHLVHQPCLSLSLSLSLSLWDFELFHLPKLKKKTLQFYGSFKGQQCKLCDWNTLWKICLSHSFFFFLFSFFFIK